SDASSMKPRLRFAGFQRVREKDIIGANQTAMRKKLLLADDSITIQKVVELTFPSDEFEVVTAGNGRIAVDKAMTFLPDIVLCDVIMPQLDGYQVCEALRASEQLKNVPILLLNGAFEPYDADRAKRVGALGNVSKPFDPPALVARVKELLAEHSTASLKRPAATSLPMAVDALSAPLDDSKTQAVVTSSSGMIHHMYDESETHPVSTIEVPMGVRELAARSLSLDAPVFATHEPEVLTTEPADFSETLHGPLDGEIAEFATEEPVMDSDPVSHVEEIEAIEEMEPVVTSEFDAPEAVAAAAAAAASAAQIAPPPAPVVEEFSGEHEFEPDEIETIHQSEPVAPEPVMPVMDEPVIDEPVIDEPTIDEPTIDEPVINEPVMEEPVAAESAPSAIDNLPEPEPEAMPMPSPAAAPEAMAVSPALAPPEPEIEPEPVDMAPDPDPFAASAPIEPMASPIEHGDEQAGRSGSPLSTDALGEPVVGMGESNVAPSGAPSSVAPDDASGLPSPPPAPPVMDAEAEAVSSVPPAVAYMAAAAVASTGLSGLIDPEPEPEPVAVPSSGPGVPSAEVAVPVDMVQQIAQRVISQVSERVIREIAWDVIPMLAEKLIKAEIERIKARAESERD
ncbi:MAG: response regulator, partial [Vicinamibacteria bacterium]